MLRNIMFVLGLLGAALLQSCGGPVVLGLAGVALFKEAQKPFTYDDLQDKPIFYEKCMEVNKSREKCL